VALERANIQVDKYYASEVDKYAIQVAQHNYPDTIQLGDINNWRNWKIDWASIDLVAGGSPCQGFSNAGKGLNFDDPRSALFFVFVDILNHIRNVNPNVKFLLENVKMKKEWLDIISKWLNVEPVEINSSLVSAQNRPRVYWTNIAKISQPEDKSVYLKDIILPEIHDRYIEDFKTVNRTYKKNYMQYDINNKGNGSQDQRAYYLDNKCGALDTGCYNKKKLLLENGKVRKFTITEFERLQTLPDGYTNVVSPSIAGNCIGNGWTVDVIAHIFSFLKK
jgi:DNA (cytosine-5)-methyltransferase 3A